MSSWDAGDIGAAATILTTSVIGAAATILTTSVIRAAATILTTSVIGAAATILTTSVIRAAATILTTSVIRAAFIIGDAADAVFRKALSAKKTHCGGRVRPALRAERQNIAPISHRKI